MTASSPVDPQGPVGRAWHFTGRTAEREAFRQAPGGPGRQLLLVHGPSDVGKTALLLAFGQLADEAGFRVVSLVGTDLLGGRSGQPGRPDQGAKLDTLIGPFAGAWGRQPATVVLIDDADRARDDGRGDLVADLLSRLLEAVVVATREDPGPQWRSTRQSPQPALGGRRRDGHTSADRVMRSAP